MIFAFGAGLLNYFYTCEPEVIKESYLKLYNYFWQEKKPKE